MQDVGTVEVLAGFAVPTSFGPSHAGGSHKMTPHKIYVNHSYSRKCRMTRTLERFAFAGILTGA